MKAPIYGTLTTYEQSLFPDSEEKNLLPESAHLFMPLGGAAGVQIVIPCEKSGEIKAEMQGFDVQYHQMISVNVEYNTAPGTGAQAGAMILTEQAETCPPYSIRLAPFRVYDALRPLHDGKIEAGKEKRLASYVLFTPKKETKPGEYQGKLHIEVDGKEADVALSLHLYNVVLPQDTFRMLTWYSPDRMIPKGAKENSPEHIEWIRRNARAMRRSHQNVFAMGQGVMVSENPLRFSFENTKPMVELFFSEGFTAMTAPGLLHCGYRPDGVQDKKTGSLKLHMRPDLPVDSDEGYAFINAYLRDLSAFLIENGWDDKVYVSVFDEPDEHCPTPEILNARRAQYGMVSCLVHRYMPRAKVMEAVKSAAFRGYIDVMVPLTEGYQKNKEQFDQIVATGNEVWNYTCCVPNGYFLNRFLDKQVSHNRILFWGCEKNRVSGFLHWAWNFFYFMGRDPYEQTSCCNDTGLGTDYPCGDAFITYPGDDENHFYISMRLESQRKGIEDAMMLAELRKKDETAHDALVATIFEAYDKYNDDPATVSATAEKLLQLLEK